MCNHKTQAPIQKVYPDHGSFPQFLKALPTWARDETKRQARSNCVFLGWMGSNLQPKEIAQFFVMSRDTVVLTQLISIVPNVSENYLHGSYRTVYPNYPTELQT